MTFKVDDRVTWGGKTSPHINEKTGPVIQVVPPGQDVYWDSLPEGERYGQLLAEGMARNHESYLVRVGTKVYWPRVSQLRLEGVMACPTCLGKGTVAPNGDQQALCAGEHEDVARARIHYASGWDKCSWAEASEDCRALLAEVDRLRVLLAVRTSESRP